jgi:hypothetical protein
MLRSLAANRLPHLQKLLKSRNPVKPKLPSRSSSDKSKRDAGKFKLKQFEFMEMPLDVFLEVSPSLTFYM